MSGQGRMLSWVRNAGAGAVAVAAIGLAVWEGWENRMHNRLSVVPKLDAGRNFDMVSQAFQLQLMSTGLGPAVVRDTWLYVDARRIHHSASTSEFPWQGAYDVFGRGFSITDGYFGEGAYLVPGEIYRFLDVSRNPDAGHIDDFRERANRIDVVTCYCSVYGDHCRVEHAGINDVPAPPCGGDQ